MRKIQDELFYAIDEACSSSEDYNFAVAQKLWRPVITCAAKPFVDITEANNNNRGHWVDMICKTVDGKAIGEPYCMAFVQSVIAFAEKKLNLVSPLKATEHVLTLWNSTGAYLKTTKYPVPGYIAIWQHGKTSSGHAGIILSVKDTYFKTIEGNSYGPDGKTQGIFTQERLFHDGGNMKLLGFLSPF